VKVWGEILEENRGRLQFFKEKLDFEATEDKALSHLAENYSHLLQGVVEVEDDTAAAMIDGSKQARPRARKQKEAGPPEFPGA